MKKYEVYHLYHHSETIMIICYMTKEQLEEAEETLDEMGSLRDGVYGIREIKENEG